MESSLYDIRTNLANISTDKSDDHRCHTIVDIWNRLRRNLKKTNIEFNQKDFSILSIHPYKAQANMADDQCRTQFNNPRISPHTTAVV
jgi:hypothetical protein